MSVKPSAGCWMARQQAATHKVEDGICGFGDDAAIQERRKAPGVPDLPENAADPDACIHQGSGSRGEINCPVQVNPILVAEPSRFGVEAVPIQSSQAQGQNVWPSF